MTGKSKPDATDAQIDDALYRVLDENASDVLGGPIHSAVIGHATARLRARGLAVERQRVQVRFQRMIA